MNDLKQDLLDVLDNLARERWWVKECPLRARLERAVVTEPQPTDEELLDALRRELGNLHRLEVAPDKDFFYDYDNNNAYRVEILRAPNGIKRTAEALRWLAGVEQGVE